jgi:Domain of unknown function (DUF4331)
MKNVFGLCAVSLLGVALVTTACGDDDDNNVAAGGAGAGATAGKTGASGSAGKTATGGTSSSGGKTGAGGTAGKTSTAGTAGTAPAGAGGMSEVGGAGGAGGSDNGPPGAPVLGAQIDRMGRPGVNTALTDPFDIVAGKTPDEIKDAYNAESDPAMWAPKFKAYINQNLAILDSLDSTGATNNCGNQLLYASAAVGPARYDTLAGVLVDDRLYVNTAVPVAGPVTCGQYLGVEANAVGVTNADCGGRTLAYDVIDSTYSALATGHLLTATVDIHDGIASDSTFLAAFPFLAAPQ